MKKIVVISLGGSLIVPNGGIAVPFLRKFRSLILGLTRRGWRFVIITGGGTVCRTYQAALRELGVYSHVELDWMGIRLSRTNAHFLRILFGAHAVDTICIKPALLTTKNFGAKKILFAGGEKPGGTTDRVAVQCAVGVGASAVMNLSNVDYIYDRDPKHRGARSLHDLSWPAFKKLFPRRHAPGAHVPFDPVAARLAEHHGLTVAFLGANLSNVNHFLQGKKFRGTVVATSPSPGPVPARPAFGPSPTRRGESSSPRRRG